MTGSASMKLNKAERSGRQVIEAKKIGHTYVDRTLIRNFSTTISPWG